MIDWIFSDAVNFAVSLFVFALVRYFIMTGAYYFVVCKLFDRYLFKFKINQNRVPSAVKLQEMKWATLNCLNFLFFGFISFIMYEKGMLAVYTDLNQYGILYAILVVPFSLVLLDTYFYWVHYVMHKTSLSKFTGHGEHHQFVNISPWSAFSVSPLEGFIELISRPLLLMILPMHPLSILGFLIVTFALNIIGHSGYEFFPKNYATSWTGKFKSNATFHYMHHIDGRYNLSLFFSVWDRIMGTLNPNYEEFYLKIKESQSARGVSNNPKEESKIEAN